jgi:hypothetical protein
MGKAHRSHRTRRQHPLSKPSLSLVLIVSGGVLYLALTWVYDKLDLSFGIQSAQVAVAILTILVLFLILVGIHLGIGLSRLLRQHGPGVRKLYRSHASARYVIEFLGYGPDAVEAESNATSVLSGPNSGELLAVMERPRRRGRPPTYSLDRWKKVVLAWENRDVLRNPMTLEEFLSEEFGVHPDGSPRVSENSFYDWRKRVFKEIRKEAEADGREGEI